MKSGTLPLADPFGSLPCRLCGLALCAHHLRGGSNYGESRRGYEALWPECYVPRRLWPRAEPIDPILWGSTLDPGP